MLETIHDAPNRNGPGLLFLLPAILAISLAVFANPAPGLELRFGLAKFADYNPLADIDKLEAWGFDYSEPALSQTMTLTDAEFEIALLKARATRIRVEAMNWFVPADIKLTGPNIDQARIREYVRKSLSRAQALGAAVIVFGSGGARSVPEGFAREQAWIQLKDFLQLCGDEIVQRNYGMVIGIEPLRKAESNIINTASEAYRLAREIHHPKVRIIVDFYHLAIEQENPDILLEAKEYIVHLHISNPNQGRVFPKDESEEPRYKAFFMNLRRMDYRGRISLEANTSNLEADARAGLAFLKKMHDKYR